MGQSERHLSYLAYRVLRQVDAQEPMFMICEIGYIQNGSGHRLFIISHAGG